MNQKDPRLSRGDLAFTVAGPAGALEVIVTEPAALLEPAWLVVIGHPHPQMGGTMHNKVVHTLARSVRDLGGVAVRFNYRGVEGSEGDYDDGVGEVADYVAVYQWALARFAVQRTCLAGFSFGSYISATALSQVSGRQVSGQQVSGLEVVPAGLLLVAPPVARMPFETLPAFEVPSFVIQGEQDDVVAPESVYEWVREREDVAEDHLVRIAKADHFFHGCLSLLKKEATSVFQVCLGLAEESS